MAEPVVAPVYRAFPRCVYKDGTMRLVSGQRELAEALADGWAVTPHPPAPEVIQESADVPLEKVSGETPGSSDAIAPIRRKRGRPSKPAKE